MQAGYGARLLTLLAVFTTLGCEPSDRPSPQGPATPEVEPDRATSPNANASPPPNVLLYLIDTLRTDRIGAYGYEKPTTPTIDELAADGTLFEHAYAPGPWTLPSVVSLMLSQPMCRHGVVIDDKKIDPETTPLAEVLQKAGYRTASFIANSYAGRPAGLDRGFEVYEGPVDEPAERIAAFLDQNREEPFFVYVHDIRPHDPHRAQPEYLEPFGDVDEKDLKRMGNRANEYRKLTRADYAQGAPLGSTRNTREQNRALARLDRIGDKYGIAYDARVREADDHLEATLDELETRGLLENTVVFVVSDHGEELGDRGGWLHDQSVYDELVRSPLILRMPRGAPGVKVETPVSLIDIAPTIAELAQAEIPEGAFEGLSLLPLLQGEAPSPRGPRVVSMRINQKKYYRPWKRKRGDQNLVVRDGPWKAVWNVEPDTIELYNLDDDPEERTDRSTTEPKLAKRLEEFARAYLRDCAQRQGRPIRAEAPSAAAAERLRALGYIE